MGRLALVLLIIGGGLAILFYNHSGGSSFGLRNDDFADLVYLTAWLAVLGSGLLLTRRSLTGSLRALAIWLAILAALVAGYQYRYEMQDVLSRMSAGLVPPSPLARFDEEGRATVMMEKRPSGHFEIRGAVDGVPVHFVVDTGATRTVLTEDDAHRAGFDVNGLSFTIPVSTANGTALAASARAKEIIIGDIVRRNQTVLVAADGSLGQSLLGMNFISSLSGFDMRGDRLILRD
ncbi:TIGR02281 family clan AA aspartic protease [Pseudaminobacter sp. 19-2017]|uniref:TIGR02281 family clan AA aspartic protease n=1 Tax=Pseudaminobacter soli (ex Zhang et al. 2022) TaxID=2831468 RepID=A0A942DVL7_9HYPH|nr:TIGR02281 family clan AA aspartic protease [Pseudaminobacter soli]MBS3647152.1 TIGR02281 family clan AA aspartic protease [Pseudaminobacter soli]